MMLAKLRAGRERKVRMKWGREGGEEGSDES